jgi:hypothetical protein
VTALIVFLAKTRKLKLFSDFEMSDAGDGLLLSLVRSSKVKVMVYVRTNDSYHISQIVSISADWKPILALGRDDRMTPSDIRTIVSHEHEWVYLIEHSIYPIVENRNPNGLGFLVVYTRGPLLQPINQYGPNRDML